jgi:hypothetical protein
MKANVPHEYGGSEVLKFEDYPGPNSRPRRGSCKSRSSRRQCNRPTATLRRDQFFPVEFPGLLAGMSQGRLSNAEHKLTNFP